MTKVTVTTKRHGTKEFEGYPQECTRFIAGVCSSIAQGLSKEHVNWIEKELRLKLLEILEEKDVLNEPYFPKIIIPVDKSFEYTFNGNYFERGSNQFESAQYTVTIHVYEK